MMGGAALVAPVDVGHGFAIGLLLSQCPGKLEDRKTLIDYTMVGRKLEEFAGLSLQQSSEEWLQKEVEMGW